MQVRARAPFTSLLDCAQRLAAPTSRVVPARAGALRLATVSVCLGRWLLPWACVLGLSGALAHAAQQGLATTLLAEPAAQVELVRDGVGQPRPPAPAGSHWVTIASIGADGTATNIACLTRTDLMSTDVIQVPLEGLDLFVSQLCAEVSR